MGPSGATLHSCLRHDGQTRRCDRRRRDDALLNTMKGWRDERMRGLRGTTLMPRPRDGGIGRRAAGSARREPALRSNPDAARADYRVASASVTRRTDAQRAFTAIRITGSEVGALNRCVRVPASHLSGVLRRRPDGRYRRRAGAADTRCDARRVVASPCRRVVASPCRRVAVSSCRRVVVSPRRRVAVSKS